MADIVFLLHGMGEFGPDWEQDVVGELRRFCDGFSKPGPGDFDRRFQCMGLNYSLLFREILEEWARRKDGIDDLAAELGATLVEKLVAWIADENTAEKNFFWTHPFDVATYRLLPTVRDAVKVRVALQIFEATKNLPESATWSVIAHSLGTAVAHDTLQAWFTQPLAGGGTLGQHKHPLLLQMVANVSRILQNSSGDVFNSDVRPGRACDFYFTAHHPLDPFTVPRPFLPAQWPGPPSPENYMLAQLEHDYIQQPNIHDIAHYLRHPDVVIPLFRCLAFKTYIPIAQEQAYREQFKLHGELTDPALIALRQKIEDAGVALPDKWTAVLTVWNRVQELAA
jgi:hypothetical protein